MSRRGRKNSDKMYSKTYYSYGSEAYKYSPEVEYDRRRRRNLPIERKVGKAEKYKKAIRNKTHYEFVKE